MTAATQDAIKDGVERRSKDDMTAQSKASGRLGIVHVIKHSGHANGNVNVAVDLACVQASRGDDVTFVSAGGTFNPLMEQYGVKLVQLPHEQNKPFDVLNAALKLTQLVRKKKPAVIHAHMMSSAMIGYVASRLTGVPLITTVHNSFDPHSVLMRLGDRVVAVSEAERGMLLSKGYKQDQVVSIINGANNSPREPFLPHMLPPDLERPCILIANALHRRKGVFDVINSCAEVFKDFPEWRLYIAGEGPDTEILKQQAIDVGISNQTTFLGFVSPPSKIMQQCDIFILASYADPGSLAIGEARWAGCAMIATSVGGTTEMLDYGKAGRLFKPGDTAELTRHLRELMSDEKVRKELAASAKNGSEIFEVGRLTADYEKVYREAMKLRGR